MAMERPRRKKRAKELAQTHVVWRPNPGPQTFALSCPAEIILYGGAVGGGKSDWLLGDAAFHCAQYGSAARGIVFRRTYPELEELMTRAHELYAPLGATWHSTSKTWTFAGGGTLRLRYLERDAQWTRYQGHQFTWVGFDEAGLYATPYVITMLRGRMRSATGVPCRLLLTANPGGVGHDWLRKWFMFDEEGNRRPALTPFYHEEIRAWLAFIPSKLTDNPQLMEHDPNYANRIGGPAWLRQALLNGDWDVKPSGGILMPELIIRDHPPAEMRVYAGIDPAASPKADADFTAICVYGVARIGKELHYWILYAEEWRADTEASTQAILDILDEYKPTCTWMEGGPVGVSMLPWIRRQMKESGRHHPLLLIPHGGSDKIAKAAPLQAAIHAGCIHLAPKAKHWEVIHDRWGCFTGEKNGIDDMVDAGGIPLRYAPRMIGAKQPLPEAPTVARSSVEHQERLKKANARSNSQSNKRFTTKKLW